MDKLEFMQNSATCQSVHSQVIDLALERITERLRAELKMELQVRCEQQDAQLFMCVLDLLHLKFAKNERHPTM